MTQLLQRAVATVSALSEARQDELALVLLQLAGIEQPIHQLSPEEEAERGEFASDEEVAAVWARFRR